MLEEIHEGSVCTQGHNRAAELNLHLRTLPLFRSVAETNAS